MQELFVGKLPTEWTAALAAAFAMKPAGYTRSGTVMCAKFTAPEKAPGVAVVGDAAFGTSWRLGYSMETAVSAAASLGRVMRTSETLSEALKRWSDEVQPAAMALAKIDRLVRPMPDSSLQADACDPARAELLSCP